ncbi:hypothetical protein CAC42_776 [Sphaceloma murrayae]|uniref:Derlin n=1 Tax=Sphaceloma murrayae TaxID=2082308 RepID=A0A2K1QK84_9PEZI|nr:hypothetical protein CAC42_776 [Sphaceloma murrayae]
MDAMFGGGIGGDGAMGQVPLEQWFFEMPVVTRWWTTAIVATGLAVQCHMLSPFQLFYTYRAVFVKSQYWRLLSTFVYFGPLSIQLVFHIFFIQRYARMLEESAPSAAHFSWMMAFAMTTLLCLAPLFDQGFLGTTLSSTLTYVWSRKHPDAMLTFLGIFTFRAPWLPFVMIGLSVVLHEHWPWDEFFGIAVGHVWYFFNEIYPSMSGGSRPLDPPRWWRRLFDGNFFSAGQDTPPPAMNRELAAGLAPEVR